MCKQLHTYMLPQLSRRNTNPMPVSRHRPSLIQAVSTCPSGRVPVHRPANHYARSHKQHKNHQLDSTPGQDRTGLQSSMTEQDMPRNQHSWCSSRGGTPDAAQQQEQRLHRVRVGLVERGAEELICAAVEIHAAQGVLDGPERRGAQKARQSKEPVMV